MNEHSKNKRSTSRPSFKQSRRGRAYYSAQSARTARLSETRKLDESIQSEQQERTSSTETSSRHERRPSRTSARRNSTQQQEQPFEVAKHRHFRWEIWFVIAVVLLLALILGSGGLIAAKRSQDAMSRISASSTTKASQAASAQQSNTDAQTNQASQDGEDSSDVQPETNANVILTNRDEALALDPDNTEWVAVDDDRKVVYLTFDDGPSAYTQQVLDILDRYGCKATFFVVGGDETYYPMIGEAYKRGHTIGMHTYSHDYDRIYSSEDAFFSDLSLVSRIVKDQIGYVPVFIRFAGGSSNTISRDINEGIMSRLVNEVRERGYQYFDWDISFGDGAEHSAEEIIEYVCEPTDLQKIVILCHDSSEKQTTIEALPTIIEHYQSLGYSFEALSRTTAPVHHEVTN